VLDRLGEHGRLRVVPRGRSLLWPSRHRSVFGVVVGGTAKLTRVLADGDTAIRALLGPGEPVGACPPDGPLGSGEDVVAVTEVVVLEVDGEVLEELLDADAAVAAWLMRRLSARLRRAWDVGIGLRQFDVPARLARLFLDLAATGGPVRNGALVEHGLTQLELAQCVGAHRVTVAKALTGMERRGWVTLGDRRVRLQDVPRLRHRCGDRDLLVPSSAHKPGPVRAAV
jgi:CRP/FNR family cyclic AMP-dependent transcriptional regulator